MFNTVSNTVNYALNRNESADHARAFSTYVLGMVIALLIVVGLNFVVGPWLWNNVLARLVPVVGKARWYDTVLLSLLLGMLLPK